MNIPKIVHVRQTLDTTTLEDPAGAAAKEIMTLLARKPVTPGARVGITAGSRGITNIVPILRAVVATFKDAGAEPLIIPAMGSHGGATAEGQAAVLAKVGITEETVGAPIVSSMDTVVVGATPDGVSVHVAATALQCDHIVSVNRVKPHTGFSGRIESGVSKMLTIGLGKKNGAETAHLYTIRYGYERVIVTSAEVVLDKAPVLAGLGIVENGVGGTAQIALVEPESWFDDEAELLKAAYAKCPKLPFDPLDVLLVDEIGKQISGTGIDTKVIGRIMNIHEVPLTHPRITRIVLRDLAKPNDGNVLGMGLADFITRKFADQINAYNTNLNCITSVTPEKGRMPIVCEDDRQALETAIATAGPSTAADIRLAWIRNTSTLKEMWVSSALAEQGRDMPNIEILSEPQDIRFDNNGDLMAP